VISKLFQKKLLLHGDFLGRVFQKERNKKTNDGVFLGTIGTFQNGILENILCDAFREMAHSDLNFHNFHSKFTAFS
jgi:hypothetical protein